MIRLVMIFVCTFVALRLATTNATAEPPNDFVQPQLTNASTFVIHPCLCISRSLATLHTSCYILDISFFSFSLFSRYLFLKDVYNSTQWDSTAFRLALPIFRAFPCSVPPTIDNTLRHTFCFIINVWLLHSLKVSIFF